MSLAPVAVARDIAGALGVLQQRAGPPAHWVALRAISGQIFELDSLREAPAVLTVQQADCLLAKHPDSYAIESA